MRRAGAVVITLLALASPLPASGVLADADVVLTQIAALDEPLALAVRPGDDALYIAEKGGTVVRLDDGTPTEILDISSHVSTGGEQGLLGLTFSPSGDAMFINYTNRAGDTLVKRFTFAEGAPVPATGKRVLKVGQPFENHNGGNIGFGPDGYMYLGMGDGGSGGDPGNRGQRLDTLLGKMLRIAPKAKGGYTIPSDNPFVGRRGNDEIWSFGLRNPWRWSFDRATGDLWIGDVGQNEWEEIDHQPAASNGGENYGWRLMEGTHEFSGPPPAGHVPPVHEYSHAQGCSVTGGYVYRGSTIPDLVGAYVFGDFCAGELQAFTDPATDLRSLGVSVDALASFGEDAAGELYVLSLAGPVYRIDPAP